MKKFIRIINRIKDYIIITIGCILMAIALNMFLIPYKIAAGGVSGFATVLFYLSNEKFPVGIIMLIINIPLFIFGYKYLGKKFMLRTAFGTVMLSLIVDISKPLFDFLIQDYFPTHDSAFSTPDVLLFALFGGFLLGIGLGFVFYSGGSTGGTDFAATLIQRKIECISVGQLLLYVDVIVVIFATIVFKSFKLGLYSVITLYVTAKVMDTVLEGTNFTKGLFIISAKSEEIAKAIMQKANRGVTGLNGKGMYSQEDKTILFCAARRREMPRIKDIIKEADENAFVVLTDIREVLGEGF